MAANHSNNNQRRGLNESEKGKGGVCKQLERGVFQVTKKIVPYLLRLFVKVEELEML